MEKTLEQRAEALEKKVQAMQVSQKHAGDAGDAADPLAAWKALKPGDKVLLIGDKTIWEFVKFFNEYNDPNHGQGKAAWKIRRGHTNIFIEDNFDKYQPLHTGPFDASKLKVGDWVWWHGNNSWVPFIGLRSNNHIGILDGDTERASHAINFSFSPPLAPSPTDLAVEEIWRRRGGPITKEEIRAIIERVVTESSACDRTR